jgi:uncharacterized protein YcbK (DUF882 family)
MSGVQPGCCDSTAFVFGTMPVIRFRARHVARALAVLAPAVLAVPVTRAVAAGDLSGMLGNPVAVEAPRAVLVNVPVPSPATSILALDQFTGRSGQLRAAFLTREDVDDVPALHARFGDEIRAPGIRAVPVGSDGSEFSFVTLKPWRDKLGSFINTYHVGWWPGERRPMPGNYDNPVGFIEVTPDNADLRLSTHFTLRSFITRDQARVWPKYVVLREELLDKLELVLTTLEAQGIPTRHVVVLSGFRTPQYNQQATFEGAAYASRHQYGDAADVIIDADRDGRMDDLNRDGVIDFLDTDVINRAIERVERRFPDLVGGLGLYHAMGPSGPFAHIDVRGTRARWSNDGTSRAVAARPAARVTPTGTCKAPPEFAHLCRAR